MDERTKTTQFKSGLLLCGLSVAFVPLGFIPIGGGPCAGPSNTLSSAVLLSIGLGCVLAALCGSIRVFRSLRAITNRQRLTGSLTVFCAGFAFLVGGIYTFIGFEALQAYLRY